MWEKGKVRCRQFVVVVSDFVNAFLVLKDTVLCHTLRTTDGRWTVVKKNTTQFYLVTSLLLRLLV
jgi:hypothetical protein